MRVACCVLLTLLLPAPASPMALHNEPGGTPLRVRGEVVEMKRSRERGDTIYDLRLRLEFENTGRRPVILLLGTYGEGEWWLLNRRLARSARDLDENKAFYVAGNSPAFSGSSPEWAALRRRLDRPTPPRGLTRVIPPGGSYPYVVNTFVAVGDGEQVPDTLWLQLTFEMWPFNLESSPRGTFPFGQDLRRRWAKSGTLVIGNLSSEPIRCVTRPHG